MKEGFDEMKRQGLRKLRLLSIFTLMALILSGCGKPFVSALRPAGDIAKQQYDLILFSFGVMTFVIIVVVILFTIVIVRFRRKREDEIPKQVEGSFLLEIVWTVIPIMIILLLSVPTVAVTFAQGDLHGMFDKDEDGNPKNLIVNVRAHLYWWEFEYPDLGIVTSQDLVIPTGENVYFQISSADVKHSFWVPPLGGKLDANPDNVNRFFLHVDPKKAEEVNEIFWGKCAELCGSSHAHMDFKVKAIPRAEFDQWVKDMKNATEPEPSTELARKGEELYMRSCISCHAITASNDTPPEARIGPNLTNFAERIMIGGILEHNEENLKDWIINHKKIKPGNKMPEYTIADETNLGLYQITEEDLDALAAYLMELKVQDK